MVDIDELLDYGPPPPFHTESHLHQRNIHIEINSQLSPAQHANLVTFVQQALGEFLAETKVVKS